MYKVNNMNELDERKFTSIFDFVFKLIESRIGKEKTCNQIDSILGVTLDLYNSKTEDESWKLSD